MTEIRADQRGFEFGDPGRDAVLWIELFYDLAFVAGVTVIVSQMNPLRHHTENFQISMVVVVLFLIWLLTVLVFNFLRVDPRAPLRHHIRWRVIRVVLVFIQSAAIITASVTVDPTPSGFYTVHTGLVSISVAVLTLAALVGVSLKITTTRSPKVVIAGCLIVAAALLPLGYAPFAPRLFPWLLLAIAALLVVAAVVMTTERSKLGRSTHLATRFRLLMLIVIGAAFASVATDQQGSHIPDLGVYFLAMLFPIAVFGAYFGMAPPIGKRIPTTSWWILVEILFAMAILFTGSALALREVEHGLVGMFRFDVMMGILFVANLVLIGVLCLIGRQVQRSIIVTYFISAAALAVATGIAVSLEIDTSVIVVGQSLVFALTVVVVTAIASFDIHSRSELPWSVTDY